MVKCCTEKKWLDEDDLNPFCLETDEWCKSHFPQEDPDQFPDIKRRTLSGNPSPPIFKGLTFYRHESFSMPREDLKGLIECAGGNLLANNPLKAGGNFKFKLFLFTKSNEIFILLRD
jgi:hypothetical protein